MCIYTLQLKVEGLQLDAASTACFEHAGSFFCLLNAAMAGRGFSSLRARTLTEDAIAMHQAVSPDRWCVTRADLKYLGQQVMDALEEGHIQYSPESSDSEDADVSEFGPSIYVVNEQYIKPITAEAGKMSWALMMNPDGLECDLFVSHAWQEGIFEFLSKVLGSWPLAARSAWCCMLANPQNLNIGSMLQSPKTSPFALALQASRHVLVVPNRHKSVYCRLWCGYEAYVASEHGKIIQIASATGWRPIFWSLLCAMAPVAIGVFLGKLCKAWYLDLKLAAVLVASMVAFVSACTGHVLRQVADYFGLFAFAFLEAHWISLQGDGGPQVLPSVDHFFRATWLAGIFVFVIAEVDRVRSDRIEEEGQALRKHYKGSIRFAACSQPTDMKNIWDEIGNTVHEVDVAIHLLISAGMSSPSLRAAAQRGISIEEAGHAEVAVAFVFLGPLMLLGALPNLDALS